MIGFAFVTFTGVAGFGVPVAVGRFVNRYGFDPVAVAVALIGHVGSYFR